MKTERPAGRPSVTANDAPSTGTVDGIASRGGTTPAPLALIVGLGNPGPEYANHRHNVGFQILQALAEDHGLSFSRHKKAKARVAEGEIGQRHVLLAKPQTFMNLSGKTVGRLSRDCQIPPDCILAVYDDLDLPLGRLRIRPSGGSGGHKGLRSIIEALGSQDFARLRVGIGRPPGSLDPAEYVLQPFAVEDQDLVAETLERAGEAVESWLADGIVAAMDRFNRPPPGASEEDQDEQSDTTGQTERRDAGQPALLLSSPASFQLPAGSPENDA
jgi:PTH1 family peptidyl-tRNA hydrolase